MAASPRGCTLCLTAIEIILDRSSSLKRSPRNSGTDHDRCPPDSRRATSPSWHWATPPRTPPVLFRPKAAVAVVQGGPDRLKDIHDPFGDGPFEYRALEKGFELKSKLLYHEKTVTLTVGPKQ
jgi:hypothetical protein